MFWHVYLRMGISKHLSESDVVSLIELSKGSMDTCALVDIAQSVRSFLLIVENMGRMRYLGLAWNGYVAAWRWLLFIKAAPKLPILNPDSCRLVFAIEEFLSKLILLHYAAASMRAGAFGREPQVVAIPMLLHLAFHQYDFSNIGCCQVALALILSLKRHLLQRLPKYVKLNQRRWASFNKGECCGLVVMTWTSNNEIDRSGVRYDSCGLNISTILHYSRIIVMIAGKNAGCFYLTVC